MKSNLNQIIKNLLEALEAQEKQIKELSGQLKDLQMNNEGQDSELKDCTDRIDILESELSDLENLDRQVNDNESNLECLESRFCEFKEITEKKSKDRDVSISSWLIDIEDDNELEGRIEKIETWVDTHQYNSIVNEDDLKTAIINLLS